MYLLNGLDFYCRWHDRETSNGCGHTRVKNHRLQWCFSVFLLLSARLTFFRLWCFSTSCLANAASRKEIYHGVSHAQRHGREVFTPDCEQ